MKYRLTFIFLILLTIAPVASFGELTTYELYVGETLGLSAKLYEDNNEELDQDIKWTTSDSSVVTVDDGIITAVNKGFATVTYESNYGASVHAGSVYISVKPTVQSVELIVPKNDMEVGETMTTDYTVEPVPNLSAPLMTDVTYSTSDSKVLKVDKNGVITATGQGTAYVYVQTKDSKRKDFEQITVEKVVYGVVIEDSVDKLLVGEAAQLNVKVLPESAFEKNVYWKSTDHISVNKDGLVKGQKPGTGYVTVYTIDGKQSDTVKITVESMVEDIEVSENRITIDNPQNEYQLTARLIPLNENVTPLNKEIKWTSSNSKIASVNANGLVRVKKDGMVNITAKSEDGDHTAVVLVSAVYNEGLVIEPISISLGDHPDTLQAGETFMLEYKLQPLDTTEDKIDYDLYGGDSDIHKKDGYFEITCYDEGRYTFVVSTENDITVRTSFEVKSNLKAVEIIEDSLERDKESGRFVIYRGQTGKLDYVLKKASISSKIFIDEVDWSTSHSKLISINDDGEFEGRAVGDAIIRIETKDSNHFDTIPVEVQDMTKKIELPSYAIIGLNMTYEPAPHFIPKEDLLYGYKTVLDSDYKIEITEISIPYDFVEKEMAFEKERRESIQTVLNSNVYKKNTQAYDDLEFEKRNSIQRYNLFEDFKEGSEIYGSKKNLIGIDHYVDITEVADQVTDRNFNKLKVVKTINNNRAIEANFVSRIEIKVTSLDGELEDTDEALEDTMVVYADGKTTELRLYDGHGQIIETSEPISEEVLEDTSADVKAEDQNERIEVLKADYTGLEANKRPSNETLIALDEAKNLNLIQDAFKDNYRRGITRLEMAKLCLDIYDLNMPDTPGNFQHSIFIDTDDETAIRAFQYGIVSATVDRKFNPNQVITREEMTHMFFRTLLAMNMDLNEDITKEKEDYFLDEDMIQDAYRQAVGYLAYDHSVVTGITDDRFWPQVSAQIDYTIKYAMNIINALK